MKRFWIMVRTELKAWRQDPITALGGLIPPLFILLAFGLLFGGRLSFKIAVVNHDSGLHGAQLVQTVGDVLSPFGTPYYDVVDLSEIDAWQAYRAHRIDGLWEIPADFSQDVAAGQSPKLSMHFSNYNDDRAKNQRIYTAEILWRFYEEIGLPGPPLALAEEYPRPEMIEWLPVIAVGVVLLGFMLGGMINAFMAAHRAQVNGITLEIGLAPRSMAWVLLPNTLLALIVGLVTGTVLMGIVFAWFGAWPGEHLWAVLLLAGLVILFWMPWTLFFGLRARPSGGSMASRQFAGAIATILTGLTVFFAGGGLGLVRPNQDSVLWIWWLFPNTHAVDPLRDLVLFHIWPVDWTPTLLKLTGFAGLSLLSGLGLAARRLRRLD
jgi:hypothetical protein